jgi:hypothetical protein
VEKFNKQQQEKGIGIIFEILDIPKNINFYIENKPYILK